MDIEARRTRRDFLVAAGTVGAGLLLTGCAGIAARPEEKKLEEGEAGITPTEGLMRQHGVLERVLLIYEEGARRIETDDVLLPENIADAATVVRAFIEDFHEGQEESVVFLPLEKAGTLAPLTAVLRAQHKAGHGATDELLKRLEPQPFNVPEQRRELAGLMRGFARMVRPHYAREDTVVFPAFRQATPPGQFAALGGLLEERERETFGPEGFAKIVAQLAQIEAALEIADLAQFTTKS
ncbi:MAG: hemerythrin domain-containing protein [Candidatus Brocadiia bacterium]